MRVNLKSRAAVAIVASMLVGTLAATNTPAAAQADPSIPDQGLPAVPVNASPVVSSRTEPLLSGVTGENSNNDSFPNTNVSVNAFAEHDGVIFVGGKFTRVQDAASGNRTTQRYLAAFDRDTGAWIDTFRPTLNGNVWDLHVTDDGRLIVAGQFTNVNGESDTTSIAALDPVTGAVLPGWRVDLEVTGTSQRPIARSIDIENGKLYIGGNFTRITGTDGITKSAGRLARVNVETGNAEGAFLPNIDGVVFDVDATGDRVYVAGNYLYVNNEFWPSMVGLDAANGQRIGNLALHVRTQIARSDKWYQQGVLAVGDDVWQVGSQHNRQVYARSDHRLIRSWVSDPWGDGQVLAHLNGVVYTGSHANGESRMYRDAIAWPELTGATTSLPVKWMAAFDANAHEQIEWVPQIGTRNGEGAWALFADSTNCLWAGGDFNRGSYDGNTPRYVEGFAKFCATDTIPPGEPTNPTAVATSGGINLAWTGSTDDRGGQVRYEILKNDSVLASFISIETFRDANGTADDRYFVRAMDYTGNRSATTQVFTAAGGPDTTRPTTPQNLAGDQVGTDVALTWTASTDNIGVAEYVVLRNGTIIDTVAGPAATITNAPDGDGYFQVRARDAAGNESFKTPPLLITVTGADTTRPTTPQNLSGVQNGADVELTWTASTDNVGVAEYVVLRNGTELGRPTAPAFTVVDAVDGTNFYQVRAVDAAGNESFKTPPLEFDVTPANDTTAPTTPTELAGVINANGDVELTWNASNDNVGVTEYLVLRNGTQIATTATAAVTVTPEAGNNWYQVRAVDAAGNQSFKTPPLLITI